MMSNLQIGLAVVGGLVLVGIVAHGAWTSRKNPPRHAAPLDPLEAQGQDGAEPRLVDEDFAVDSTGASTSAARIVEPSADNANANANANANRSVNTNSNSNSNANTNVSTNLNPSVKASSAKPVLDSLIDAIAHLTPDPLALPVPGTAAIAALPALRHVGSKPIIAEGLNPTTHAWEALTSDQHYSAFQVGIQLANRTGALSEIEYSEFVVKTQAFADALNASAEFADMQETVTRARELDQFASAHDAQLRIGLRARNTPWSAGYVQQHAAQLGFVADATQRGQMLLPAPTLGLPPILVLHFDAQALTGDAPTQSALRHVSLHLDVPQVERSHQPFERMCEIISSLAKSMDGIVSDDDGHPLGDGAIQGISQDLEKLYAILEQRDVAAGSALARRLFS